MLSEAPPIFRQEALAHWMQGQDRSVLPRFIRPRTFLCLWILLGLLIVAALLAWMAPVPVYAPGIAIVAQSGEKINLIVLVPAESVEKLSVGQAAWVRWPSTIDRVRTQLTQVEPKILSPAAARRRFGLSSEQINRAVIVAQADPQSVIFSTDHRRPESHLGSTATVEVEVGSRRALSLLPVVGDLFK